MTHALGVYWSVAHRRPADYAYFKALNPPVVKIMDGGPPDYAWVKGNLPGALVIARDWAMSEEHGDVRSAPAATGKRHAQAWATKQKQLGFDPAKTLVLGQNEPHVWEDFSTVPYNVAFLDECKRLGLRAGALQLSVGWPANTGPETPPDWTPYAPVRDAILRGNHALVLHEYWADLGPSEHWGWWGGRALKCPWAVPIVIGECGFEMAVKRSGLPANQRGWQAHISAATYAAQLVEYANRMAADPRIVGTCVFASDYQNGEWQTLDVEPAYNEIRARLSALKPIAAAARAAPTIQAPAGANVRALPDTNSAILRKLPFGTAVQPVATNTGRTWLSLAGGGWVFAELVSNAPGDLPVATVPAPEPNWEKSLAFVLRWEGGWADNPADPGGATMRGVTIGVYTRWRAAHGQPAPTKDDLRAITDTEVRQIFREWYWDASGAGSLPWPLCLAHFNLAVNAGTGRAQSTLAASGQDFVRYMAAALTWYAGLTNFATFGRAWTRRCADVLKVGAEEISGERV